MTDLTIFYCSITILGIFFYPVFTIGLILAHYNHPFLAIIAMLYSFVKGRN